MWYSVKRLLSLWAFLKKEKNSLIIVRFPNLFVAKFGHTKLRWNQRNQNSHTQKKCSQGRWVLLSVFAMSYLQAATRVAKTLWVEEEAEDKVTVFELKLCLERAPLFSLSLCLSVSVCCSTRESCVLEETVCWVCSHHSCCIEINRKRERDTLLLQKLHLCLLLSALE